jgi:hypothetical protein
MVASLDGDDVGEAEDPDLGVVAGLLDPLDPVDVEQLGVESPLVEAE